MSDTYTLTHTINSTTDDGKIYHRIVVVVTVRVDRLGCGGDINITSDDGPGTDITDGIGLTATNLSECGLLHFAKVADEFYGGWPTDRIASAVKAMLANANAKV